MLSILYLMIPLALVFITVAVVIFFFAVRSGQFDDLEGPAHRILDDDQGSAADQVSAVDEQSSESIDRPRRCNGSDTLP